MKLEYQLIKEKNDCCIEIEQFENLLQINQEFKINVTNKKIKYKDMDIKYSIKKQETNDLKEIIFVVTFEYDVEKITESNIENFEKFDNKFLHTIATFHIEGKGFFKNTLIDDISSYYSNILYPKINLIENKLRKIIYVFMEKNLGSSWMKKSLPTSVNADIKKKFEDRNVSSNENDYLINVDFISLGEFLFKEYPTGSINNILDQVQETTNLENDKIKNQLNKIIKEYKLKSNYSRYFDNDLENNDLEKKWEELYKYRCDVAHNKRIRKGQYDKCTKLINEIDSIFDKCIRNIDSIKVPDEDKNKLENVGISTFSDIDKKINMFITMDNLKEKYDDYYYDKYLNEFKKITIELPNYEYDIIPKIIDNNMKNEIYRRIKRRKKDNDDKKNKK